MNNFDLMQQAAWTSMAQQQFSEAEQEQGKAVLENMSVIVSRFDARRVAANTNPDLSETGRQSALRTATTAARDGLDRVADEFLSGPQTRAGSLAASLQNATSSTPDVMQVLLMIERRSQMASMEELDVWPLYERLCRDGSDDLTCLAIEHAGQVTPLLDGKYIEQGKAVRAARIKPDAAAELESVRAMYEIVRMARNAALRECANAADTVVEQAAGIKPVAVDADD